MKISIVFGLLVLFVLSVSSAKRTKWHELQNYSFEKYVHEFGKQYSSAEEAEMRQLIFDTKLSAIKKHNLDSTKTWKKGVNQFTDRTTEEFESVLGARKDLLYLSKGNDVSTKPGPIPQGLLSTLPVSVDWRQQGIISAVKDQGQCGSCWTFGSAETVESYWAQANGQLTDLSEQQILDCTPNPNDCGGTGGCGGGTAELAYAQIMQSGGISTEWTYPYTSYFGKNFQCGNVNPFAQVQNFTVLPSNQYAPVMQALANVGPLAINVDASTWGDYESGVFNGCNQTHPDIDHVVQLVGYATDATLGPYWIVRNSWSPAWGEDGYIRLFRQTGTQSCGVDLHPQDGTGCNGGPSTVAVCGTCAILYDVSYVAVSASH